MCVSSLTRPEVLAALVERLVTEPPSNAELSVQYRHPNLACEVLQCSIPAVLDRLAGERALLDRLCAPLGQTTPLNPLLASFLARTLSLLLAKNTEQVRTHDWGAKHTDQVGLGVKHRVRLGAD